MFRRITYGDEVELSGGLISDCPGEDRCHGYMKWCDKCGDTADVCDAIECDAHRCIRCGVIVPDDRLDWSNQCKECEEWNERSRSASASTGSLSSSLRTP